LGTRAIRVVFDQTDRKQAYANLMGAKQKKTKENKQHCFAVRMILFCTAPASRPNNHLMTEKCREGKM
jgi:hypothetical protein